MKTLNDMADLLQKTQSKISGINPAPCFAAFYDEFKQLNDRALTAILNLLSATTVPAVNSYSKQFADAVNDWTPFIRSLTSNTCGVPFTVNG